MRLTAHSPRAFSIEGFLEPEAGAALLFIHDTWHEGAAIESGTKYVLRSDVMYGPAA